MSYILDALRKADAQRESDPARGIHAQPLRLGAGEQRVQERYRTGWWAATAAGVAALAIGGWTLYQERQAVPDVPPARTEVAVAAPPPVSVVPPPPATAVLPPPVVVAPPVAAALPAVVAPTTAANPAPVPAARPASVAAATPALPPRTSPAPVQAAVASAPAAALANAPALAVPAAAPAPAPTPASAEAAAPIPVLPADAPKLAISGGVYSANAAQRMLIVNGQVFNEGGEVGPGMVLEEIRPKAAVLRFRGSRYSVPY
jgi:general secretion pathway protein B